MSLIRDPLALSILLLRSSLRFWQGGLVCMLTPWWILPSQHSSKEVNELISSLQKKKTQGDIIKVDFAKAFYMVD